MIQDRYRYMQELSETDNKYIQTDQIIVDFAKAFDKVPHRRLLYKLNYWSVFLLKYSGGQNHKYDRFVEYF
jgi:hypothetical protein